MQGRIGMRTHRQKHVGLLALVAAGAGVAGLLAHLATPAPNDDTVETAIERTMLDAAVARIAAASANEAGAPSVHAAPRPATNIRTVDSTANQSPPPDGYTLAAVHGEMTKARLQRRADTESDALDEHPAWLNAPDAIATLTRQAAGAKRGWTFGWIRLARNVGVDDVKRPLQALGGAVAGSAGRLIRAKLPGDEARLQAISALPEVDGLGAAPREAKLPDAFVNEARARPAGEWMPVFVTLMADDPAGRWRQTLEDLGAVVGHFHPDIRVYAANVDWFALNAIAEADFVSAIEPIGIVRATHDTAVPAMGADALRMHRGSPGVFSGIGGTPVPIAVMDTGLNINHPDISSNRRSICGANFTLSNGRDYEDLWQDENGHGTHVTGTIAGNGYAQPSYAGMAPRIQHIRFAKVLTYRGWGATDQILRGMDFLSRPSGCAASGRSVNAVKPLIVNMSLSATSLQFDGRDSSARKLDSIVWSRRQLYAVAQANSSVYGFSDYGAAKNSLAVGSVQDSGYIASFSSHGPTADGRLKPQVVATGVDVYSVGGNGQRGGYARYSGTSMASPAAAGVAALLMDAVPAYRGQPALTRARLMASAIKPDPWIGIADRFPSSNTDGPGTLQARYGLGKVSATTSVLDRDRADGWANGGASSELQGDDYAYHDIVVPEGASRLDLVMTWDEPAADTIASTVLNDLDLWLDQGGDCGSDACGEYSSTSRKDNVEWLIVRNPSPGIYRAKLVPRRVYTAPPRAALAWTVIRGASTPTLRLVSDKEVVQRGGELTLALTTDAYVAAGTRLYLDCRPADGSLNCGGVKLRASVTRGDGVSHIVEASRASLIPLGELAAGEVQEVRLNVSGGSPGRLHFTASAWNAKPASLSVDMVWSAEESAEAPAPMPPENAEFAAAEQLEAAGSRALDLLLAPPEPGEPAFTPESFRVMPDAPAGSVWYSWTAPADDMSRFSVRRDPAFGHTYYTAVNIDVFQGDRIGSLAPVASSPWGAVFFAEAGTTYRIRLSSMSNTVPLILQWSQGPRPANDDFQASIPLAGTEGSIQGSNQGATLEYGELAGGLAATAWYSWIAPSDGAWRFELRNSGLSGLVVLVFRGDSLPGLRLVSSWPMSRATFQAGGGQEYRIAVAAVDAYAAGGTYDLTWETTRRFEDDNDNFQGAEELAGASSSLVISRSDIYETVEPGEPVETGVRTRWWTWVAPEDGVFTFRLRFGNRRSNIVLDTWFSEMRMVLFSGDRLDTLQPVGRTGSDSTSIEVTFQAIEGERYSISIGRPAHDYGAFRKNYRIGTLSWGPTPPNDDLAAALQIADAAGSITASNRFSTMEPGEQAGESGLSSMWYAYEAPPAGWVRFWVDESDVPFALAAYLGSGDEMDTLELLSTSHHEAVESEQIEVLFQAEAGSRYLIRVGTAGSSEGGDFTLHWEQAESPVWLKYIGRLADGDAGANSAGRGLGESWSLAFNDTGTVLYVASDRGLHVFDRNPDTGELAWGQSLDGDWTRGDLMWHARLGRLYAYCGQWHRFSPGDDVSQRLQGGEVIEVPGAPAGCYYHRAFLGPLGSFAYIVSSQSALIVLAVEPSGDIRHQQTVAIDGLRLALIANGGGYAYAATSNSLVVFERDAETGRLEQAETVADLRDTRAMTISDDDRYLFTFDYGGQSRVFDLGDDASDPQLLDTLPPFGNPPYAWNSQPCEFAAVRNGVPAAEVLCRNSAFAVRWRPEAGELAPTDYLANWQQDRFKNHIPVFGRVRAVATSPDGKHALAATEQSGILIFERVGNALVDVGDPAGDGRMRLSSLWVEPGKVSLGALSALSADFSGGCISMTDTVLDGVVYTVGESRWQTRPDAENDWADIEGTRADGEVCAHTPTAPGRYRLAAEITVDGDVGNYASNVIAQSE